MHFRFNTFTLALIFCFSASTALAGGPAKPAPQPHQPFSGFHMGLEAGVMNGNFENQSNNDAIFSIGGGQLGVTDQQQRNDLSDLVALGRLFFGYAWDFNRFSLGMNLSGSLFKAKASDFQLNNFAGPAGQVNFRFTLESTIQHSVAYSLLPGYLLSPNTLLFAQVGAVASTVKIQAVQENRSFGVLGVLNNSRSKTVFGVEAGLGFEQMASSHLALVVQYLYRHYGRVFVENSISVPGSPLLSNEAKMQTDTNTFLLGVDVYFHKHADDEGATSDLGNLTGLYLDAYFGVYHQLFDYSSVAEHTIAGAVTTEHEFFGDASNINVNGGLAVGYGYAWRHFYLGAVLSRDLGRMSSLFNSHDFFSTLSTTNQIKVAIKNQVNLDLKPGLVLGHGHSLLFALVGYTKRRIKINSLFVDLPGLPGGVGNEAIDAESNTRRSGLRLGVGFMTKITSHMAIGIQDIVTLYNPVKDRATAGSGGSFALLRTSLRPRTNDITFHFSYFITT